MRREKDLVGRLLIIMCVMFFDGMIAKEHPDLCFLIFFIMIFVGTELMHFKD